MSNTRKLYELPKLRHQLRRLKDEIDDLRLQAECVGSVRPKEHVQSSPDLSARFEDTVAERAELEKQYQALLETYYERAEEVQAMISRLNDPAVDAEKMYRIRMLLVLRYMFDNEWKHIAIQLGVSLRQTHKLRDMALDMFNDLSP